MALDHALAVCSQESRGVLRLYSWMEATVSLGRNEPARGLYDRANAVEQKIEFVRRPTGGRAVLHSNEVTYAIVIPVRALGGQGFLHRDQPWFSGGTFIDWSGCHRY